MSVRMDLVDQSSFDPNVQRRRRIHVLQHPMSYDSFSNIKVISRSVSPYFLLNIVLHSLSLFAWAGDGCLRPPSCYWSKLAETIPLPHGVTECVRELQGTSNNTFLMARWQWTQVRRFMRWWHLLVDLAPVFGALPPSATNVNLSTSRCLHPNQGRSNNYRILEHLHCSPCSSASATVLLFALISCWTSN